MRASTVAGAQTGNFTSLVAERDRENTYGLGAFAITSTVGSTPTVTVNLQASIDGQTWVNVPYALVATPTTYVLTALTITTAVTTQYIMQPALPWQFFRAVASANTNVTLTIVVFS